MLMLFLFAVVVVSNAGYLLSTARFIRALAASGGTIDGSAVEGSLFSRVDQGLVIKAYLAGGRVEPDTEDHRDAILRARSLMIVSLLAFGAFVYLIQAASPR